MKNNKKKLNNNKIKSLVQKKEFSKIIKLCKKAIASKVSLREAYSFLARAYTETDQFAIGLKTCDTYLALNKNNKLIIKEKSYLLFKQKNYSLAVDLALTIFDEKSPDKELIEILAKSYLELKKYQKSYDKFKLLEEHSTPKNAPHYYLGVCLQEMGRAEEAFWAYTKQLQICGDDNSTLVKLAPLADKGGSWKIALVSYQKLLGSVPQCKDKLVMPIGGCYLNLGEVEKAIKYFKMVPAKDWKNHCGTLLSYHYHPKYCPELIYKEHFLWAQQHPVTNYKRSEVIEKRKINIGFISPDFRNHPVTYFMLPIFNNLDREKFNIFCFGNVVEETEMTLQIQKRSDLKYVNIHGLDTSAVCSLLEEHNIDILVDLAGHTAASRLDVMARKVVPVQMTYLGYPDTTGLPQIDYRISDFFADPPKLTEPFHSEQILRLPKCFLAFEPPSYCPDVPVLPYKKNGYITFGSFNKVTKLSHHTIVLWAFILKRIPTSKLALKSRGLVGEIADLTYRKFEAQGITRNRIQILPLSPTHEGHFAQYGEMDIALDSYPYNGTTTTFEALWMGRPVISREGGNHVSRVSGSILRNSNMTELVVDSDIEYINVAEKLVNNLELLDQVSRTLRPRMIKLGLVDGKKFVKDFENALEKVWSVHLSKVKNNWHGERICHPCGFQLFVRENEIPELTKLQYDYCLHLENILDVGAKCLDIGFSDIISSLTIATSVTNSGKYLLVDSDADIEDYLLENVNGNLLQNTKCTDILEKDALAEIFVDGCNLIRINASQYFEEILEEVFDLINQWQPIIQINTAKLIFDINEIISAFKDVGYSPFFFKDGGVIDTDISSEGEIVFFMPRNN
ncbi:MAG: hypothetical protein OCC45_11785 [Desulfotalea sp.]